MKLIIEFSEFDVDIAEVPQSVADDIRNIEKKFSKWVYDKDNKLSWDSKNRVFCFRGDLFVFWLNRFVLSGNEKAELTESQPESYDRSLPKIRFRLALYKSYTSLLLVESRGGFLMTERIKKLS